MRTDAQQGGSDQASTTSGDRARPGALGTSSATEAADLALRRTWTRRIVLTAVFAAVLVAGIVAIPMSPADSFPMFAVALVVLGAINGTVCAAGARRAAAELRQRRSDRRALAAGAVDDRGFDQTNGVVDLGQESERADPSEGLNTARRLSSMNAAGIAFGNGTH